MAVPPPLTTLFTPPSPCLTDTFASTSSTGDGSEILLMLGPSPSATECYPSPWNAAPTYFYSPGLCPEGYFTANSSTVAVSSGAFETRATCCPDGYAIQRAFTTSGDMRTTLSCSQNNEYWAFSIEVRYQSTDLPALSAAAASQTYSPATGYAGSMPTGEPLSTGAKAGIGVGVSLFALALIGLGAWLVFARRRKRKRGIAQRRPERVSTAQHFEIRPDVFEDYSAGPAVSPQPVRAMRQAFPRRNWLAARPQAVPGPGLETEARTAAQAQLNHESAVQAGSSSRVGGSVAEGAEAQSTEEIQSQLSRLQQEEAQLRTGRLHQISRERAALEQKLAARLSGSTT